MTDGIAAPETNPATIVLLAGPGDSTDIVANYLTRHAGRPLLILEEGQSRRTLATRRAKRVGWTTVAGQISFVTVIMPLLRRAGRGRRREILGAAELDDTPFPVAHHVPSVNAASTLELLASLHPDVVVVNGTRIIAPRVLHGVSCPFVNLHAGITPRYRGVHGGYWALAEGRPDQVGSTVHLVDPGIDTGGVLGRARFTPSSRDSIATYPYLHLAAGLPLLTEAIGQVLEGGTLAPEVESGHAGASQLYYHPTAWGYLWRRYRSGVR